MKLKNHFWYPPAETKLSKKALLQAFIGNAPDFSKELSSYLGIKECLLGDSGRGLLAGLLKVLKKRHPEKTEVIIPGYTCYSVAASVVNAGLKVGLYDIDPKSFTPDMKSLSNAISDKTLAVVMQHLFGLPCRAEDIITAATRAGIWLIEDAAQGLGGSISGKYLGTMGDFGLFSFGRGKPLPLGCGGALVGKHSEILKNVILKTGGRGAIQIIKAMIVRVLALPLFYGMLEKLPLGLGKTEFDPGIALKRMPEKVMALGSMTLSSLTELNSHRRRTATVYLKTLSNAPVEIPESSIPVYTRFPVMAGKGEIPLELRRLGVRRMYPKAIADEPAISLYLAEAADIPGSRDIAERLITLPTHMNISGGFAQTIASMVKEAYSCC
jgi:dTDP-4-amino-4,6-dideoxygalactose transaminase